jgi:hypothetical protein
MIADNDDADLGSFFSRPLEIAEYSWSSSVTLFEDFNPWTLYCENPKVMNRLCNFNLLKAKMRVKILINGNGFYYGRILASYLPRHQNDRLTRNRALIPEDSVAASQRPHVYLDPTLNQGGELCLPFFLDTDSMDIPTKDWTLMGEMNLRELNALQHANGNTDPITVTVLAWLEDVVLSVPTSANPAGLPAQSGFEPQAGKSKGKKKKPRVTATSNKGSQDEYGTGPVSGPASTVGRIAGMLTSVPYIGPFATATQIAATGVGSIARLFGYSRAPTLAPILEYTPRLYGDHAHCNTPDTSQKLSLDVKQELSVDGTITGLDSTDEMTIKSIACRESFLDTTTWGTADSTDTIIASLNVVPDLVRILDPGASIEDEYHMPASCFAVKPFKYWRGSMKYRFQIVASAYHKGRLKVQWDPTGYTDLAMNTQYTHIIDISDDKDFTIEVGWGSHQGWLKVRPTFDAGPGYTLRGAETSIDTAFCNGTITVSVLNTLTSPSSSAGQTVDLNLFVSAGEDIEVAVPTDEHIQELTPYLPFEDYVPQSGVEAVQADEDTTEQPSAPVQDTILETLGNELDDSDMSTLVYHGESITSFRSVLKRYAYTGIISMGSVATYRRVEQYLKHMPPCPGTTANAVWGNQTVNFCKMTPLAYVSSAFKAQRGGVRWKANLLRASGSLTTGTAVTFARLVPNTDLVSVANGLVAEVIVFNGTGATSPEFYGTTWSPTWSGYYQTPTENAPNCEIEIPYQTQRRFWEPKDMTSAVQESDRPWAVGAIGSSGTGGNGAMMFCAGGEDFSLHYYTGPPVFVNVNSALV